MFGLEECSLLLEKCVSFDGASDWNGRPCMYVPSFVFLVAAVRESTSMS